jgi:hypothetical protein
MNRWRATYVNGSIATVKAADYRGALERAAKFSTERVRDLVLETDQAADRARAIRWFAALKH